MSHANLFDPSGLRRLGGARLYFANGTWASGLGFGLGRMEPCRLSFVWSYLGVACVFGLRLRAFLLLPSFRSYFLSGVVGFYLSLLNDVSFYQESNTVHLIGQVVPLCHLLYLHH